MDPDPKLPCRADLFFKTTRRAALLGHQFADPVLRKDRAVAFCAKRSLHRNDVFDPKLLADQKALFAWQNAHIQARFCLITKLIAKILQLVAARCQ